MRLILKKPSRFFAVLSSMSAILMVLAITYDVTHRTFFGGSVPGILELNETLLVVIIFLGLAYAEQIDVHVRTTIVTSRIPARSAYVLRSIAYLSSAAFLGWMAWASIDRAQAGFESGESKMGLMQWPIWPARIILALGVLTLTFEIIVTLIHNLRSAYDPEHAERIDTAEMLRRSRGV